MSDWISVKQEMPRTSPIPEEYLIAFTHKTLDAPLVSTGYWYSDHWEDGFGEMLHRIVITHWMPLPAPPLSEDKPTEGQ